MELARIIAGAVNKFSFDQKAFNEAMGNEHRTLQQSFTRLCIKWLVYLSKQEHYDGRNEASVKLARQIVEAIGEDDLYLPLV